MITDNPKRFGGNNSQSIEDFLNSDDNMFSLFQVNSVLFKRSTEKD